MSERRTSPPSTPEATSDIDPHRIEGAPEALQIEAIEKLRADQAAAVMAAELQVEWYDTEGQAYKRNEAYGTFDDLIADHLERYNIKPGDPQYDEISSELRGQSLDKVSKKEWEDGKVNPDGSIEPSGRDKAEAIIREEFGTAPPAETDTPPPSPDPADTPPPAPAEPETPPPPAPKTREEVERELENSDAIVLQREKVEKLREELAVLSARRQGRLWDRKNSRLSKEYAEKRAVYNRELTQLTLIELLGEKDAGLERTNDEIRMDGALKLVTGLHALQENAKEKLKGQKISKAITFLTSGNLAVRILKGVGIGLVVGAGVAVTFGTGGGAAAAAGGLVTLATRAARNFAVFDNKSGRGIDIKGLNQSKREGYAANVLEQSGAEHETDPRVMLRLIHQHLMSVFEQATKSEQKTRRKSTYKALATVAGGAIAVELANALIDATTGTSGAEKLHSAVWDDANATDQAPAPGSMPPAAPSFTEKVYDKDALTLSKGEGWYQTFKDLDIPKGDWNNLLDQAGPKLHEIEVNGKPLAYKMPNGEWGIRMTPDGKMPKEALDAITKTHEQMKGIVNAPVAPVEAPVPQNMAAPAGVEIPAPRAPADIESLTSPVATDAALKDILDNPVVSANDILSNPELSKLTEVASWIDPQMLAERLGVPAPEWARVEEYIIGEVKAGNSLYTESFEVNPMGYLHFVVTKLSPATLADIISNIPVAARKYAQFLTGNNGG